mgnify:CR=1 FL=1
MDRIMKRFITGLLLFVLTFVPAVAQEVEGSRKAVRYSGDALLVAMPLATLTSVLVMKDWQGLKQAAFSTAATLGTTYLLKYTVKKQRPDGSDFHSFPSGHTSIMFANAAFVQRRYGWKWGAPAYVLATYVGWSRTYARKHDWWDVAAGAVIGAGSSYLFTRPFAQKHNLVISPTAGNGCYGFYTSLTF